MSMDMVMLAKEFGAYAVAVVILACVVKFLYDENRKLLDKQAIANDKRESELMSSLKSISDTNQNLVDTNRSLADSVKDVSDDLQELKQGVREIKNRLGDIDNPYKGGKVS